MAITQKTNEMQELATITKEMFWRDFSQMAISKSCRHINTPEQIFEQNLPTLGSLKRRYGEEFVEAYLETWIIGMTEWVNIGKNMSEGQIRETASFILEDYIYLTLADINLVFKRAKKSFYGKIYDRLDGQIILDWFSKYHNERCIAGADYSINQKDSLSGEGVRIGDREIMRLNQFDKPVYKKAKFNKKTT